MSTSRGRRTQRRAATRRARTVMRIPDHIRWPGIGKAACGKVGYRDEIEAKIALGLSRQKVLRERCEQRVYRCDRCPFWHLTSQDKRPQTRSQNEKPSTNGAER